MLFGFFDAFGDFNFLLAGEQRHCPICLRYMRTGSSMTELSARVAGGLVGFDGPFEIATIAGNFDVQTAQFSSMRSISSTPMISGKNLVKFIAGNFVSTLAGVADDLQHIVRGILAGQHGGGRRRSDRWRNLGGFAAWCPHGLLAWAGAGILAPLATTAGFAPDSLVDWVLKPV